MAAECKEFKGVNELLTRPSSVSTTELQDYQTTSAGPESTNTSNNPAELTVTVPAKSTEHEGVIIAVIFLRITEMVINILSYLSLKESSLSDSTTGIIYSLVPCVAFTITGILLAIYAFGGCKKPCTKVLAFESVFCLLWAVVFVAATSFLVVIIDHLSRDHIKVLLYGYALAFLYVMETCMNTIRKAIRNEEKVERDFIKFCKNYKGWNQPASAAYNGTDVSNDPNDHWTRKYDLNAISDGCIIIL